MFSPGGAAVSPSILLQFHVRFMANVAPFRALRYDPGRVALTKVVTQPYDKITLQMQDQYYDASPHNLVRIILGKRQAGDDDKNNVYTRAASYLRDWRRQGIFRQDSQPSLYAYSQRFRMPDGRAELERRGFIGLGRLEDYSARVVFRHEQTLAKPKADRLELLRATGVHFEQLFMVYSDGGEISAVLPQDGQADIEVTDEYGVLHRLWQISDPGVVSLICGKMRDKKLIIADGHHRYETALNYRDQQRAASAAGAPAGTPRERSSRDTPLRTGPASEAPHEFVMMTFIDMDSPGLVILPTHRVVHGLPSFSADRMQSAARSYFSVEEVDASLDAVRATGILREAGHAGTALLAVAADRAYLMHSPKANGSRLFAGLSPRQQSLDVVQLHKCLLEGVLGLSEESIRNQQNLGYIREAGEAFERVHRGDANVAFLMNPVRMEQVRDLAFSGEVLPQKSTDFYPKLLSGLTMYALD
jgi:uncharacterized protein (DUF1015 family)